MAIRTFVGVFYEPTAKLVKNKYIVVLDEDITMEQRKVTLGLN